MTCGGGKMELADSRRQESLPKEDGNGGEPAAPVAVAA